jgi:hypothetical protein
MWTSTCGVFAHHPDDESLTDQPRRSRDLTSSSNAGSNWPLQMRAHHLGIDHDCGIDRRMGVRDADAP